MATAGSKAQVMYGRETTYGTAVTPTKVFDLAESYDLRLSQPEIEKYGLGSRDQQVSEAGEVEGTVTIEGTLLLGYPIIEAIGTTSATGTGPYVHTVAPASPDEAPALTIEVGADMSTDSAITLAGCRCNSLTLRFTKDAPVEYSAEFFFKDIAEGTSLTSLSLLSEDALLFSHGTMEIPTGTGVSEVESGELTISNKLYRTPALGSRKQNAYGAGRKYTLTADINYDGPDLLDKALGSDGAINDSQVSLTSLYLKFTRGSAGTTSERTIEFASDKLLIGEWGQKSSIDSSIVEDISATIKVMDGDASNYIKLTNNTSSM